VTGPASPAGNGRLAANPDQTGPGFTCELVVPTAAEMAGLGRRLAGIVEAGDLVVLSGPLGAGKTTLAQGMGDGLSVRGPITSPTFVIARVHPSLVGGPDLVHADAYRLGSRAELDDLDLDADLATAVTVVEWGEGLVEGLADSFLAVQIAADSPGEDVEGDQGDQARTVRVTGWGQRWQAGADRVRNALDG
jgi:tRNA threonylcarbamoyladenosine biosynthesis protein TsaE